VAFVGRVPVPVVQVVGVALVWHGHVTALLSMLMSMALMGQMLRFPAFIHMVPVDAVNVTIVCVIGVIAVRERDVTAGLTMGVLMAGVRGVLNRIRHFGNPPCTLVRLS
jgi:hypothetical protein